MTYQEFTRHFKLQTESLSYQKKIDLAISICKKLFFDYQKFSEDNNWGDPHLVLDTIKFIESSKDLEADKDLLKEKINQIEAITPDTEDFADASYALNSCVAVCETLVFLTDYKAECIYAIGTCLTDTIDFKIQEDDDLTEDEIDKNSDMIAARQFLLEMSR
jgi:uncharacterized protein YjaG (DUF416 family)